MSLAIDIDKVTHVMVGDEWHQVLWWDRGISSFYIDSYEFIEKHTHDDNLEVFQGKETTGFGFETTDLEWFYGPLSQLQAVRSKK